MARTLRCARVRSNGQIKWAGELIFVGETLVGEPVGILETEGGDWLLRYADVKLGYIHPQRRRLSPRPLRGVSSSPRNRWFAGSPPERSGFEPLWGFSCQVVIFGLLAVLCSEVCPGKLACSAGDSLAGVKVRGP
jgi:hypothetical protein